MLAKKKMARQKDDNVFTILDNFRNLVALIISRNDVPETICYELNKHGINIAPPQISCYLKKRPINRFESAMAKDLEEMKFFINQQ